MGITDELRTSGIYSFPSDRRTFTMEELTAIADRIDAEHEEAIQQALMDEGGVPATDENMAEHGWVRLPVDADGVPWKLGDRTESGQTIEAMGLNRHGWHFVGNVNEIDPAIHRHYHAPTVEDVLREFALACEDAGNAGPEVARIAAEYAKRLTLADGEGE